VLFTFLKADGTRDALTGFAAKLEFRRWNTAVVVERSATVADQVATPGDVTWSWQTSDMTAYGDFEGELWVGNGANKYRSQRFRWLVVPAIQVATV
jgi:hypothetical protein